MHETSPPPPSQPLPTAQVAPWWHTALLVLVLLGGSILNTHRAHVSDLGSHHVRRYLAGIATEWILFLLAWWGLRLRRVSIAEVLGFRRGLRAWGEDLLAAVIFWIISIVVIGSINLIGLLRHMEIPEKTIAALGPQNASQLLLWIALSITAGIVEEFVFRGYLLRQLSSPVHALWLGIVGSSLIFGLGHGYEGTVGMIAITAFGALFCGLTILRRTLRPGMIAHAWQDILAGVLILIARHIHLV
jgi:hypothetical protein